MEYWYIRFLGVSYSYTRIICATIYKFNENNNSVKAEKAKLKQKWKKIREKFYLKICERVHSAPAI